MLADAVDRGPELGRARVFDVTITKTSRVFFPASYHVYLNATIESTAQDIATGEYSPDFALDEGVYIEPFRADIECEEVPQDAKG